jgi:glucokinase
MTMLTSKTYGIVADVGGTNTRVALVQGAMVVGDTIQKFANREFTSLEAVLGRYIAQQDGVRCATACIAVAGPVRDGAGELTNLNWRFDNATLTQTTGARQVAILNDLQAAGHALGRIDTARLTTIIPGKPAATNTTQIVIGVGTGFNAAPVYSMPNGRIVTPSESGHIDMPISNEADFDLSQYIRKMHGFAGVEEVLSGRGLENIYQWLMHRAGSQTTLDAAAIMAAVNDGSDPIATQAVQVFVRLLGAVAGNLSLIELPFGGVYLIGGVARAMAPYFAEFGFQQAFRDKGRFSEFMDSFSVTLIQDDYAALAGCAGYLTTTH